MRLMNAHCAARIQTKCGQFSAFCSSFHLFCPPNSRKHNVSMASNSLIRMRQRIAWISCSTLFGFRFQDNETKSSSQTNEVSAMRKTNTIRRQRKKQKQREHISMWNEYRDRAERMANTTKKTYETRRSGEVLLRIYLCSVFCVALLASPCISKACAQMLNVMILTGWEAKSTHKKKKQKYTQTHTHISLFSGSKKV